MSNNVLGSSPEQGTRRDSVGNPVDQQGLLRESPGNSLDSHRSSCALQLIGDIVNGCSDIKVQRTYENPAYQSSVCNVRDSCTKSGENCMDCGNNENMHVGSGDMTLCTSSMNNQGKEMNSNEKHLQMSETCESRIGSHAINNSPEDQLTVFHILPWQDVLFTHICLCLSLQDIFHLRASCRIGRDCINEYFTVCPSVNLSRCSQKVTPTAFRLVTYSNYKLHTLILRQVKSWLTDEVLIPAFACSSHLRKVDLTSCSSITPRSVVALAGRAPGLREIYLRECSWLTKEAVIMLAQNCTELEKLDLTGCWAVDDEAVVMVSVCCRNLVFLSIAKIYGITDYSVRCLATNCTRLQHMNMHGCWRVSDGAIQLLGEYCQKLRMLQVKECREITEISLARLRSRGVKIDVQHPGRRNANAKNVMPWLKLQV